MTGKLTPVRNVSRQISQCHRKLTRALTADPGPDWLHRLHRLAVQFGSLDLKLRKLAYPTAKKGDQSRVGKGTLLGGQDLPRRR